MKKTPVRRLLVGALFAFVGALLIDGTAQAQAGCTGPDPFASLGGGPATRAAGSRGYADPGGAGATPPCVHRVAASVCTTPDRSRRSAVGLLQQRLAPAGMRSRAAQVRPPRAGPVAASACTSRTRSRARRRDCYNGGWLRGHGNPGGREAATPVRRQWRFGLQRRGPVRGARRRDLLQRRCSRGHVDPGGGGATSPESAVVHAERTQHPPERSAFVCLNGTCITGRNDGHYNSIASRHGSPT